MVEWLERTAQKTQQQNGRIDYSPIVGGLSLGLDQVLSNLQMQNHSLGNARQFFCWYADAGSRVGLGGGSAGSPTMGNNPSPLMRLYRDGELEGRISRLCKDVFSFGLTLDRVHGDVRLLVGEVDLPIPPLNRPTEEYSNAVRELPRLEAQGDGVKSFMGLVLHILAGYQTMVLIDEPEAFLHQSQAKSLGRWMATVSKEASRQVVTATHSKDIVLGLLSASADVTILRLTRDGNDSHLNQLRPEDLASVWNDPVLRYSNALDGLFYESVVICEGDADCRFYAAVLDDLAAKGETSLRPDDVLFVPSGGKAGIPKIAKALKSLGVKTYAIVDFDAMRQSGQFKPIVESLGGDWSIIRDGYVTVAKALGGKDSALWGQAKTQGLAAVPAGDPNKAAVELLGSLQEQGVFVVPVGQLEGYDRTITGKSSMWVNAMLDKRGHETCPEARDLIRSLAQGA